MNSSTSIQPEDRRRRGLLDHASGMWSAANRYAVVLTLLVGLFIFFSASQDNFFTQQNVENLLTSVSILWVVSIGMTFVVLTAGIDLSVGSLLALTGIILSKLFNDVGLPAPLAVLAAIGIAALIGAGVNGVLIGRVGLSFFVVTLGTLSLYQGIVSLWSHTQTTYVTSTFIGSIGFGEWLGIPTPIWIMLGTYIAAFVVLRWTYFGRDVYAVGGNIEAARLSGINVARTLISSTASPGCARASRAVSRSAVSVPQARWSARTSRSTPPLRYCSAARASSAASAACRAPRSECSSSARSRTASRSPASQSFWQQVVTGVILIVAIAIDRVQQQGASLWSRKGPPPRRRRRGARRSPDE